MKKHVYFWASATAMMLLVGCHDTPVAPAKTGALEEPPLGAAYKADMAVQLEDPHDAVSGHGDVGVSAVREAVILNTYNNPAPPAPAAPAAATSR